MKELQDTQVKSARASARQLHDEGAEETGTLATSENEKDISQFTARGPQQLQQSHLRRRFLRRRASGVSFDLDNDDILLESDDRAGMVYEEASVQGNYEGCPSWMRHFHGRALSCDMMESSEHDDDLGSTALPQDVDDDHEEEKSGDSYDFEQLSPFESMPHDVFCYLLSFLGPSKELASLAQLTRYHASAMKEVGDTIWHRARFVQFRTTMSPRCPWESSISLLVRHARHCRQVQGKVTALKELMERVDFNFPLQERAQQGVGAAATAAAVAAAVVAEETARMTAVSRFCTPMRKATSRDLDMALAMALDLLGGSDNCNSTKANNFVIVAKAAQSLQLQQLPEFIASTASCTVGCSSALERRALDVCGKAAAKVFKYVKLRNLLGPVQTGPEEEDDLLTTNDADMGFEPTLPPVSRLFSGDDDDEDDEDDDDDYDDDDDDDDDSFSDDDDDIDEFDQNDDEEDTQDTYTTNGNESYYLQLAQEHRQRYWLRQKDEERLDKSRLIMQMVVVCDFQLSRFLTSMAAAASSKMSAPPTPFDKNYPTSTVFHATRRTVPPSSVGRGRNHATPDEEQHTSIF